MSQITGREDLTGRVSFDGSAHGPIDAVTAELHVPAGTHVRLLGDAFDIGPIDLGVAGQTIEIHRLHLARLDGGALDVTGTFSLARRELAVDVSLDRLPLEAVAALAGVAPDLGLAGRASAKLHVTGTPERPQLAGDVTLAGVVARGVKLGDGHLTLTPTTPTPTPTAEGTQKRTTKGAARGKAKPGPAAAAAADVTGVQITGDLFDRFHVDSSVALGATGPTVHGVVDFQRLALEGLAPELGAFGDGRGITTGRVVVDVAPGRPLAVDLLLQELALSIARAVEGADGETTTQRVRVAAAQPVHVAVRGQTVELDEVLLTTDGGNLRARGRLDGETRHARGRGQRPPGPRAAASRCSAPRSRSCRAISRSSSARPARSTSRCCTARSTWSTPSRCGRATSTPTSWSAPARSSWTTTASASTTWR